MLDNKRDEIQNNAVISWSEAGKKGTLNLSTGIGKTFCFIKATRLLPKGSKILFLAETSQRKFDFYGRKIFFRVIAPDSTPVTPVIFETFRVRRNRN